MGIHEYSGIEFDILFYDISKCDYFVKRSTKNHGDSWILQFVKIIV